MIPVILLTGTPVDQSNPKLKKKDENILGQKKIFKSDIINISRILKFDIFPSLIILFCLT